MKVNFRLYGRSGCHLCDEMLVDLMSMDDASQCSVQFFDIDTDPVLQKQFALRIPVLTTEDGKAIICEQFLDRQAVINYLAAWSG